MRNSSKAAGISNVSKLLFLYFGTQKQQTEYIETYVHIILNRVACVFLPGLIIHCQYYFVCHFESVALYLNFINFWILSDRISSEADWGNSLRKYN